MCGKDSKARVNPEFPSEIPQSPGSSAHPWRCAPLRPWPARGLIPRATTQKIYPGALLSRWRAPAKTTRVESFGPADRVPWFSTSPRRVLSSAELYQPRGFCGGMKIDQQFTFVFGRQKCRMKTLLPQITQLRAVRPKDRRL